MEDEITIYLDTSIPQDILSKTKIPEKPHVNPLLRDPSPLSALYKTTHGTERELMAKKVLLADGYTSQIVTPQTRYTNDMLEATAPKASPHRVASYGRRSQPINYSPDPPTEKSTSYGGSSAPVHQSGERRIAEGKVQDENFHGEPAAGTLPSWQRYLPKTPQVPLLSAGITPQSGFTPSNFQRWPAGGPPTGLTKRLAREWSVQPSSIGIHLDHVHQRGGPTAKIYRLVQDARDLTEYVSESTVRQIEYFMTTTPPPLSTGEVARRLNAVTQKDRGPRVRLKGETDMNSNRPSRGPRSTGVTFLTETEEEDRRRAAREWAEAGGQEAAAGQRPMPSTADSAKGPPMHPSTRQRPSSHRQAKTPSPILKDDQLRTSQSEAELAERRGYPLHVDFERKDSLLDSPLPSPGKSPKKPVPNHILDRERSNLSRGESRNSRFSLYLEQQQMQFGDPRDDDYRNNPVKRVMPQKKHPYKVKPRNTVKLGAGFIAKRIASPDPHPPPPSTVGGSKPTTPLDQSFSKELGIADPVPDSNFRNFNGNLQPKNYGTGSREPRFRPINGYNDRPPQG